MSNTESRMRVEFREYPEGSRFGVGNDVIMDADILDKYVANAIQAAKVSLLEELREAMVVQQNNPWGIKLINTELSKLRSEK